MMKNVFVLLLAGKGERLFEYIQMKKQFFKINGKELFIYPLMTAIKSGIYDEILLVTDEEDIPLAAKCLTPYSEKELKGVSLHFTSGGKDRNESVKKALDYLDGRIDEDGVVYIHDADRVMISEDFLKQEKDMFVDVDALTPVIPLHDSLMKVTRKNIEYQDRNYLYRVQTPQVFRYQKIHEIYQKGYDKRDTDDFKKALNGGLTCVTVRGDVMNFKVTDWDDLNLLLALLQK